MTDRRARTLVDADWLARHRNDPDVVILDASLAKVGTATTGPELYASGHIPGAYHFDIRKVADTQSSLPNMLPDAAEFERHARAMGISPGSLVVIYEADTLYAGARVWWMLRHFGHERVVILDGGLRAWRESGYPVSQDVPPPGNGKFVAHGTVGDERSFDEVLHAIAAGDEQVIDTRLREHFEGTVAMGGLRPGHMPGAHNLPVFDLSDPETSRLLPDAQLRELISGAGIDMASPAIVSCGSGVTACALAFALHLLGKDDVALYDGSWSEWGRQNGGPVATGPAKTGH